MSLIHDNPSIQVQQSLSQRLKLFQEEEDKFSSAPTEEGTSGLYPSLSQQTTMPR